VSIAYAVRGKNEGIPSPEAGSARFVRVRTARLQSSGVGEQRAIRLFSSTDKRQSPKELIMPVEFRFDDLDLREEPQSEKTTETDYTVGPTCTNSDYCTCNSRNTCSTFYC
jgi:hypothetical protein